MPRHRVIGGLAAMLKKLYSPEGFYRRAARSLAHWRARKAQRGPRRTVRYQLAALFRSIWRQGIVSRYRVAYWRFFVEILYRWYRQPMKVWWGFTLLFSGEHFIKYAEQVVNELEATPRDERSYRLASPQPRSDSAAPPVSAPTATR